MRRDEELCVHGGGLTGKEGVLYTDDAQERGGVGAEEDREERRRAD